MAGSSSRAEELESKLRRERQEAAEREAERLAKQSGLPYLDLSLTPVETRALRLIDEKEARDAGIGLFDIKAKQVKAAVLDPQDKKTKAAASRLLKEGFKLDMFVASRRSLERVWSFYHFSAPSEERITGRVEIEAERLQSEMKKLLGLHKAEKAIRGFSSPRMSEMLELVLAGALANRASDIHLEPGEGANRLRYRVDGILHDVVSDLNAEAYAGLIFRIKLLSNLKLNVRNEPQDGRFTVGLTESDVEVRTSIIPSEYGETAVLRLLDPRTALIKLEALGFRKDDLAIVREELKKPNGLILNTGPTGSGKTTTLYAFLNGIYSPEIKIITVEDPIEYRLSGISQTQVDPKAGYTFASGLRSILRQDPDVILVGEVRDSETAGIALNASLTGHLVLSTLHTNDALGAIPRLLDLGVKPAIMAPALSLVIAQRLVRRLCDKCKERMEMNAGFREEIARFVKHLPARANLEAFKGEYRVYRPKGCAECGGLGYRGRIGIFELLLADEAIQNLIYKDPTEAKLKELARKQGMVTMQEDGMIKVLLGETSADELVRVTGPLNENSQKSVGKSPH